jgi:hypothetical protein
MAIETALIAICATLVTISGPLSVAVARSSEIQGKNEGKSEGKNEGKNRDKMLGKNPGDRAG